MLMKRHSGFSLIELLVVIAVIGVLSSILITGVNYVRNKSTQMKSAANVRSIGGALHMYSQENGGDLPVWHNYTIGKYWWQLLRPYVNDDDEVFHSPAHEEFDATNDTTIAQTISYGWNFAVVGRHIGDKSYDGDFVQPVFLFDNPSKTLVLTDGPRYDSWGYITIVHPADPDRYGDGKAIGLFLDGHIEVHEQEDFTVEDPYFIPEEAMPSMK